MIYLDYSANTPADRAVLTAFIEAEQVYIGNPNSTHPAGRTAKAEMDRATTSIAAMLGVEQEEIIYTSGASESNNSDCCTERKSAGRGGNTPGHSPPSGTGLSGG